MALTEKQEYKVEVIPPYSILQVRRADIILKDGEEVARSYHRHVVSPGDDCSGECDCVKKVAAALHDEACCAAYQASLPPGARDWNDARTRARGKHNARPGAPGEGGY